MNKIIIATLFAVLAVAQVKGGSIKDVSINGDHNKITHTDNFITLNDLHFKRVVEDYDKQLLDFEESYAGRLEAVTVNREFVIDSVVRTNKRLNPLEFLSDFTKQCVHKYRVTIPTVLVTKSDITKCFAEATEKLTILLEAAVQTRNTLDNYYSSNYKKELANCGSKFDQKSADYTVCVTKVTEEAHTYTIENQKAFETQLEAAECIAKAHVKEAIDCSYAVQFRTLTLIAEADLKIDNCQLGKDECPPCADYTCDESVDVYANINNQTVLNPFYGRSKNTKCLRLNVQ